MNNYIIYWNNGQTEKIQGTNKFSAMNSKYPWKGNSTLVYKVIEEDEPSLTYIDNNWIKLDL